MTVANNYAPVITAANGSATSFSGSWNAITATNLVVQLLNTTTGLYTTVIQGSGAAQYQVTSLGNTGFVISFNTAPASGNNVVISRRTVPQQEVPYTTSRGFQGSVEEQSFDALTNMVQELGALVGNCIQAPIGDTATDLILPIASLRASKYLGFDGFGNLMAVTGFNGAPIDLSNYTATPTGTTQGRSLAALLGDYKSVLDLAGVLGDGSNDDTAGLINMTPGQKWYFPTGHYKLSGAGVALFNASNTEIAFGPGVTLDMINCLTAGAPNAILSDVVYGLSLHGAMGTPIALTVNAAVGALSVTLANVTGLAAGNWVVLQCSTLYESDTGVKCGEQKQIKSIVGNVVNFYNPTRFAYTTAASAKCTLMNFAQNIKISGQPRILGGNLSGAVQQAGIGLIFTQNVRVNDAWIDQMDYTGIQAWKSRDIIYDGAIFSNMTRSGSVGMDSAYGCENITSINCRGYNLYHLVDSQGDTGLGGVNFNIRAINCFADEMYGASFNAHPGTLDVDYSHNTLRMVDGLNSSSNTGPCGIRSNGAQLRAVGNTLLNVCGNGIIFQPSVNAPVTMGCTISDNYAESSPNNSANYAANGGVVVQAASAASDLQYCIVTDNFTTGFDSPYYIYANQMNIHGIEVNGNRGVCSASTVSSTGTAMMIRSDTGHVISDGSVMNNSIVGTLFEQGIYFLSADAGGVKNLSIGGNTVNGGTLCGMRFENTDNLNISPNKLYGFGASATPYYFDQFPTNSMVNLGSNASSSVSDQSITSNTTLANATGLSFPIGKKEVWDGIFTLDVGAALATTGIKIAITTPSGATQNIIVSIAPDVSTTTDTYMKRTSTSGTALDFTTTNLANVGNGLITVKVHVANGATAGAVQLQIAQSTSSGTAMTVRAGSSFTADRKQ